MKILWLYKYFPEYNFDHWLHMDFAKAIKYTGGMDLIAYGHDLHKGYPNLAPIPYNKNITMNDLKVREKFDVVILNTKSRMFKNYLPPRKYNDRRYAVEIREDCWLPTDFKKWDITPKIMIEEDFHWEDNDDWYVEMGIDCILQRHWIQQFRTIRTKKHYWFPFSVDTNIFKPNPDTQRKKIICFVGCDAPDCYPHRKTASIILENIGMLDRMGGLGKKVKGNDYVKCLQNYVSHLNGSSSVDVTTGKMFEIMASGSVLFTNESDRYGLKQLFPPDSYVTYKENYGDLITKAKRIINDEAYIKETTEKALVCIGKKHSHQVRIQELRNLIKREFGI